MSARYSKTSSRGRAMTTSAVTGSTRGILPADLRSGGPRRDDADGVAALEVAHELDGVRRAAAQRRAQRADRRRAAEAVHALADQWRAAAVGARVASGGQPAHRLAQQCGLQVGLVQGPERACHGWQFVAPAA